MPRVPTDSELLRYFEERELSGYEAGFARTELTRGVDYHRARIEMLGWSGESVLDAGCGIGNWSLALATRFARVTAFEFNARRLDFISGVAKRFNMNITPVIGSVETLPFTDNSFDGVFCNGVIFLVDAKRAMSEFARVVRPGGEIYVSYNAKEWWKFLIDVRGPQEPNCRTIGTDAFFDRAYRLLSGVRASELLPSLWWDWLAWVLAEPLREGLLTRSRFWPLRTPRRGGSNMKGHIGNGSLAAVISSEAGCVGERLAPLRKKLEQNGELRARACQAVRAMLYSQLRVAAGLGGGVARELLGSLKVIDQHGQDADRDKFYDDVLRLMIADITPSSFRRSGQIIEPDEMGEMLTSAGLVELYREHEGMIVRNADCVPVTPIHRLDQGVWETLARKPDRQISEGGESLPMHGQTRAF